MTGDWAPLLAEGHQTMEGMGSIFRITLRLKWDGPRPGPGRPSRHVHPSPRSQPLALPFFPTTVLWRPRADVCHQPFSQRGKEASHCETLTWVWPWQSGSIVTPNLGWTQEPISIFKMSFKDPSPHPCLVIDIPTSFLSLLVISDTLSPLKNYDFLTVLYFCCIQVCRIGGVRVSETWMTVFSAVLSGQRSCTHTVYSVTCWFPPKCPVLFPYEWI